MVIKSIVPTLRVNQVSAAIVSSAMEVHSILGPGLLINFHVAHLKDGIKRMVDGWNWESDENS